MSHARQTLRDAFATAVTGLTITGARVYKSRSMPLDDDCLPGLLVTAQFEELQEPDEPLDTDPQLRVLQVDVKGYDKLKSGLDDQLDDIAEDVEVAIFGATFNSIYALDLISTEIDIIEGAEKEVGEITLSFQVQYMTSRGVPGTLI